MTKPYRRRGDQGFTLIELLVVVVIIGILAAIAIPVFLNQKAKADDAQVKAQAPDVAKAIETVFADTTGTVTGTSETSQVTAGTTTEAVQTTNGVQWSVDGDTTSGYCIAIWSTKPSKYTSSKPLYYDSTKGGILPDTATGCAHGTPDVSFAGGAAVAPSGFTVLRAINSEGFCGTFNASLLCWGSTGSATGQGSLTPTPTTVPIPAGVDPSTVTVSHYHGCYLQSGDAYCWGSNQFGQFGNGTTNPWYTATPVPVSMTGALAGKKWATIVADGQNTCGLTTDGGTYCWGRGFNYFIPGYEGMNVTTPVQISGTEGVHASKLAFYGGAEGCILSDAGLPTCWGGYGPSQPDTGGLTFTEVRPVSGGACLLGTDKHVYCYGMANWGETGTGISGVRTSTPQPVAGELATLTVDKITKDCAVTTTKRIFCWGSIGAPQEVTGTPAGKTVTDVAGGSSEGSAFLLSDGTVWVVQGVTPTAVPTPTS